MSLSAAKPPCLLQPAAPLHLVDAGQHRSSQNGPSLHTAASR
jgi:hypothetical protein